MTVNKKTILLAAAVIAVAVLNFYINKTSTGKSEQSGLLEDVSAKAVLLLRTDSGGSAAIQGKADIKDSPYFKKIDVYNMKSGGTLILLEKYKTYQQHTDYTCGPAAALTV